MTTLPVACCQVYPLEGEPETGYSLSVSLGTPPQEFRVLLDSGSSNFAVAAVNFSSINNYPYFNSDLSESFRDIDIDVGVRYVEGEWSGRVGKDNFSFSIGDTHSTTVYISLMEVISDGFFKTSNGWVGILGMGYAKLAKPDSSVLPVMDSLVANGVTDDKFGLQLCGPETRPDGTLLDKGGRMSLGSGTPLLPSNSDTFIYAAITEKSFYKIILTNIKVGSEALDLPCSVFNDKFSIIDSGTTELSFNKGTFSAIIAKLKKSNRSSKLDIPDSFWSGESALGWKRGSVEEFTSFNNLEIALQVPDSQEVELSIVIPPQLYLKKVSSKSINIEKGDYCATTNCSWYKLGIKQNPIESVSGAVLGMMLFKGYTVEFDRGRGRVGFAPSACDINGLENPSEVLKIAIIPRTQTDNCQYTTDSFGFFQILICIMVVIVLIAMLVLITIGSGCLIKKYFFTPSIVSSTNARDLESMLLRTSSSDSEGPTESDDDLLN
ncbi:Aspartate protease [Oopsacas minuta]|uniref:Aspartate protease n=1 Tax=Oopsacas minuta TaxID=111878 RepID=A0AAV7KIN3_9METZ|nr:Aspartate protease [Oopsacas minuta]